MIILESSVTINELKKNHLGLFKTMVKAVADIKKNILAVDAELHADLEAALIENGSDQNDLWGINLYPFKPRSEFIEYTALINIRPHLDNRSMEIENPEIVKRIEQIVSRMIVNEP